jgi:hypothetical protein
MRRLRTVVTISAGMLAVTGLAAVKVSATPPGPPGPPVGNLPSAARYHYCQTRPSYCADGEEQPGPTIRGNGHPPPKDPAVAATQAAPPVETSSATAHMDKVVPARARPTDGLQPQAPIVPSNITAMIYSVFPHPDDDGADSILMGAYGQSLYHVYVVMNNGENSGACLSAGQAADTDYGTGSTNDGDDDLTLDYGDTSAPGDSYGNPAGSYWYSGTNDPTGYPQDQESTNYYPGNSGEYWPGSDNSNTTINAWSGKAFANPGFGPQPANYPSDPSTFSSLFSSSPGGCRGARLAALENLAEDLELYNGVGANYPDAGYDNYSPTQVCFSGVPSYWNGVASYGTQKDPCAYAWIGTHGAIIAFNLGDLNTDWNSGDYPTYENWGISPQDVVWALKAVDSNKATIGLPVLPDNSFVSDAFYNSTSPGGTTPAYNTEWGGTCGQYGHWNHYAVSNALYNNAIVPGVPNYGRTCSGDPNVGAHGINLFPSSTSSVASFNQAYFGTSNTGSARQYGFEVGGTFGWSDANTANCGTGSGIVESEWSCDESFWDSPATGGP